MPKDQSSKNKPVSTADQKKIKDYLKSNGHDVSKVNEKKMDTTEDMKKSICELHCVTLEQLQAAMQ